MSRDELMSSVCRETRREAVNQHRHARGRDMACGTQHNNEAASGTVPFWMLETESSGTEKAMERERARRDRGRMLIPILIIVNVMVAVWLVDLKSRGGHGPKRVTGM